MLPLDRTMYLQSVLDFVVSMVNFHVQLLEPSHWRLRPRMVQSGSAAGAAETAVAMMAARKVLENCIVCAFEERRCVLCEEM